MSDGVTAVEGGRWSESVAAAKGSFKKLFGVGRKSGSRRRQGTVGRGECSQISWRIPVKIDHLCSSSRCCDSWPVSPFENGRYSCSAVVMIFLEFLGTLVTDAS